MSYSWSVIRFSIRDKSNFSTNYAHCYGSLGEYNNQLLAIGAGDWPGEGVENKVELLVDDSWKPIADFPL